jgi:hypothetical protein
VHDPCSTLTAQSHIVNFIPSHLTELGNAVSALPQEVRSGERIIVPSAEDMPSPAGPPGAHKESAQSPAEDHQGLADSTPSPVSSAPETTAGKPSVRTAHYPASNTQKRGTKLTRTAAVVAIVGSSSVTISLLIIAAALLYRKQKLKSAQAQQVCGTAALKVLYSSCFTELYRVARQCCEEQLY